jgi:hypothetical protein
MLHCGLCGEANPISEGSAAFKPPSPGDVNYILIPETEQSTNISEAGFDSNDGLLNALTGSFSKWRRQPVDILAFSMTARYNFAYLDTQSPCNLATVSQMDWSLTSSSRTVPHGRHFDHRAWNKLRGRLFMKPGIV